MSLTQCISLKNVESYHYHVEQSVPMRACDGLTCNALSYRVLWDHSTGNCCKQMGVSVPTPCDFRSSCLTPSLKSTRLTSRQRHFPCYLLQFESQAACFLKTGISSSLPVCLKFAESVRHIHVKDLSLAN